VNFSDASRVLATIRAGDTVENVRGENRVKVNNAANAFPPLSKEEADSVGLKINVNFGELMNTIAHARRQYLTAFLSSETFFKVKLPYAPAEHQSEWEEFITKEINRPLRKSLKYFELHNSRWSSVVTHGVGAMRWPHADEWCPKFVPMSDLRIPTDTTLDFENLGWYAVRHIYTPFELIKEAFRPGKANGWDKKAVVDMVKNYKEINWESAPNHYDIETSPEKFAELIKQDGGYYASDAMPGIPLWHFFFEDLTEDGPNKWFLRIVPETGAVRGTPPDDFLWQSEEPIADHWKHLIHCQYGDLSTDAPFKFHSVRSLGFALLEPTFYTNLTRCRLLQHVHDNFNVWLRLTDPADKARAAVQEFGNLGVVREGVQIVPREQRHQIDSGLVEMAMSQLQQLQQEASSTYTQQTDTGTQKEQTAFETSVKVQQVNAMLSGLLMKAFKYESFADIEICRRFCLPNSKDPDIMAFQRRAKAAGIPRQWLDVTQWDIEPVTPLGMGNPTAAQAAAKELIALKPMLDPTAQQEVLHEAVLTVTGDSRKAARLVPLGKKRGLNDAQRDAQFSFGTLMQGVPIAPREGLPVIDQVQTILPLLAGKIVQIEQRNNMATPEEAQGLGQVGQYIGKLIAQLAQDPQEKQLASQMGNQLGQLMNQVKGLAQRGQEAAQKSAQAGAQGNGQDPAAMAKLQAQMMQGQMKLKQQAAEHKQREMAHRQKLKQDGEAFVREQRRKDAGAFADIQRQGEQAKSRMKSLGGDEE
jgi:hypothetical protein